MNEAPTPLTPKAPFALSMLLPYLWPKSRRDLKVKVILSMSCLLLAKLFNIFTPYLFKLIIDQLTVGHVFKLGELIVVGPLAIVLAYGLSRMMSESFSELRDFIFVHVSQHTQRRLALETFQHLHSLSLQFHLSRKTGALSRAVERGKDAIQFTLSFLTFNIAPTLVELILVTIFIYLQFNIFFASIIFGTIFIYVFFTFKITNWRARFRRQMNDADTDANSKAIDSLLNFETVKYFNNEAHEYERFDKSLATYEKAAIYNQKTLTALNLGQDVIITLGLVSLMGLAANNILQSKMTIGDFVMLNTFLLQLYIPLGFLGFVYRELKQRFIDIQAMFELLRVEADIKDDHAAINRLPKNFKATLKGKLEFRNVTFGYQPDRTIFKNLSFTVLPAERVAFVGPSGAGKSTLVRLLFRFYDSQKGQILLDDYPLDQLGLPIVRGALGIVPQDTVLFNDSILYNIHYGRPEASVEEVYEAAKLAQIHDFVVSLPQGYQTVVGERGLKLSGGEKQRVAIARTILKNPKVLIFDEATSALDSHTEAEVQQAINQVSKGITTLMIAHRLSTIRDADRIFVLTASGIVESGTHNELLASKGEYYKMWNRQLEQRKLKEQQAQLEM